MPITGMSVMPASMPMLLVLRIIIMIIGAAEIGIMMLMGIGDGRRRPLP